MRILVLTRSYPAVADLYQYPFVHRRVLAYRAAGHEIAVFRPTSERRIRSHEYEGVTCFSGDASVFAEFVAAQQPQVIAAHGFSEDMHATLAAIDYALPVRAWLHGSEIPAFFRAKALSNRDDRARAAQLEAVQERCTFWRQFMGAKPARFKLVFVSHSAVELAREDWGGQLLDTDYAVIPNPIDTDLFGYRAKRPEDRFNVLMIRPFDARTYGNDLAVSAILHLAERPGFDRLRFRIIGDGPLFDETLAPLHRLANVAVERRFLTQLEIARLHAEHGIFLVPTRLDTQGVSRDEAMASGLVPVTNAVSAVTEFVDRGCAALAAPDDAEGLADGLWEMIDRPDLFLSRSTNAAKRVRLQSGNEVVIPAELALLGDAVQRAPH